MADIDNVISSEDRVTLMTLHSAKGLETPQSISGRYGGRTVSGNDGRFFG